MTDRDRTQGATVGLRGLLVWAGLAVVVMAAQCEAARPRVNDWGGVTDPRWRNNPDSAEIYGHYGPDDILRDVR